MKPFQLLAAMPEELNSQTGNQQKTSNLVTPRLSPATNILPQMRFQRSFSHRKLLNTKTQLLTTDVLFFTYALIIKKKSVLKDTSKWRERRVTKRRLQNKVRDRSIVELIRQADISCLGNCFFGVKSDSVSELRIVSGCACMWQ